MDLSRLKIDREPNAAARAPARRRRSAFPFGKVLLLLAVGAALYLFRGPILAKIDAYRLPEVRATRVSRPSAAAASAVAGTAANGYIVARMRAALSADTPGRIVELNVVEGQRVAKGDVVARLYAEEYEAALQRTRADLEAAQAALVRARKDLDAQDKELVRLAAARDAAFARQGEAAADLKLANTQYARVADLVRQDFETQSLLDEWLAKVEAGKARVEATAKDHAAAEAALEWGRATRDTIAAAVTEADAAVRSREAAAAEAAATLDKTIVRAPFDGIVVLKDAEVGEVVSPNSQAGGSARGAVATMVDFESLEAQAEVPETSIKAVRVGAPVKVFLDAYPDRGYPGVVDRIWPTANREKATIEVRVKLLEKDDRLRPEMGARIVFLEEAAVAQGDAPDPLAGALLVPEEALVQDSGASAVFVVERGRVRLVPVTTGGRRGGRVAVTAGLEEGQSVVSDPPHDLQDGDRVFLAQ